MEKSDADMFSASSALSVSYCSLSNRSNYRLIASAATEMHEARDVESVRCRPRWDQLTLEEITQHTARG